MGAKTLLLALDSIEPRVMQPWLDAGNLPNLAAIRKHASVWSVLNFHGYGNGVYWPSLNTASRPEQHGRFYISQLIPGSYRVAPFDSTRDFLAEPFWAEIDRMGGRAALIDPVRTPLAMMKHGMEVQNWLAHDSDGPIRSTPPALAATLLARFGHDPMAMGSDRYLRANHDLAAFVELCCERANRKTVWCTEQLRAVDWDLFYVAFGEAHDIGHLCWHLHDPSHPDHDPALCASLGDPLLRIYRHLDRCAGDLLAAAGEDAVVVVLTGPGMERNVSGNHLMDEILTRLQRPAGTAHSSLSTPSPPRGTLAALRAATPWRVRQALNRANSLIFGPEEQRARARSRFFAVPHNDNAGAVRINLKGREPHGVVRPGKDYEATVQDLMASLRQIRDTASGRPLVSDIVRVLADGNPSQPSALPDLLVIWNREANTSSVSSPEIGSINMPIHRQRTGDHSDRGELFLMPTTPLADTAYQAAALDPATAGALVRTICIQRVNAARSPTMQPV